MYSTYTCRVSFCFNATLSMFLVMFHISFLSLLHQAQDVRKKMIIFFHSKHKNRRICCLQQENKEQQHIYNTYRTKIHTHTHSHSFTIPYFHFKIFCLYGTMCQSTTTVSGFALVCLLSNRTPNNVL